jgi:CRP-like cAMP-binding protein
MTTFEFLRREPEIRDYKKGQTIFKQGDPGSDCMFGVVEGAIDIQIGAKSRIAVINKKRFLHLVEATPNFALSMMQVITERLRRASVP